MRVQQRKRLLCSINPTGTGYFAIDIVPCQGLNDKHTAIINNNDTTSINISKDAVDSVLNIAASGGAYKVKLQNNRMCAYANTNIGSHFAGSFYSSDSIVLSISPSSKILSTCIYKGRKN